MSEIESVGVGRWNTQLTTLSFGGAPIGNLYRETSDDDAASAVEAAWDGGMRYFDTAPHYGLGLSERRLGAALRDKPRDAYTVSTKVGRVLVPSDNGRSRRDDEGYDVPATHRRVWDFSRDGILRSVEQSLDRLGMDRVDILYLHDPDDHWEQAVDHGYPALAELRDEGVVDAIGAGMNQSEMLADFVRHTDIDVVMLAGRYTLLEQGAMDDLLPLSLDRGVQIVAVGVFNSGLLSRPYPERGAKYNYEEAPPELIARAQRIAELCADHQTTLPAAALRFPLSHPAVASVGVGCRDGHQARRNLELFQQPVPDALWPALREEGLLRGDVPLPAGGNR
ncbi:aldo/keto reductase [Phytoactinopolyspora halophila]|uniref:aldo/keto reductase n=1 Tax=Phytoactinopolyspora halophila TaxID=1981511 RepID=UPI001B8D41E7|nr:aldo/keto reductase [Phytoactinopolyspora halophila]